MRAPASATPTLSGLTLNPASLVGGGSASGSVTLSAAAPSGGATVSLSDNTSAAVTPANVTVAAGASSASFTISTSAVTTSTAATLSAVYAGVTRTATLTVNPPASTALPAPSLLSPARDATPAQAVTFDWADVSGAVAYRIQIDDSSTFAAPFVVDQVVTPSQFTAGPLASSRQWWRVQGVNAAGTAGAWSSARRFTPQTAP